MLVLARKCEEKIHIGDNITITVLQVKGNTIRLGIEAPRAMSVLRGELRFRTDGQPADSVSFSSPATGEVAFGATSDACSRTPLSSAGCAATTHPQASRLDNGQAPGTVEYRRVRRERILALMPHYIAGDGAGSPLSSPTQV